MAKGKIELDNSEILDELRALKEEVVAIHSLLQKKAPQELNPLVPQFTAIAVLGTSFLTFKKWCKQYNIREEKKGGRIFYRQSDIKKLITGNK